MKVSRVEFRRSGYVFDFTVPAYLLPPPPIGRYRVAGVVEEGEPVMITTSNPLFSSGREKQIQDLARMDAMLYGFEPSQVQVLEHPSNTHVSISKMPPLLDQDLWVDSPSSSFSGVPRLVRNLLWQHFIPTPAGQYVWYMDNTPENEARLEEIIARLNASL